MFTEKLQTSLRARTHSNKKKCPRHRARILFNKKKCSRLSARILSNKEKCPRHRARTLFNKKMCSRHRARTLFYKKKCPRLEARTHFQKKTLFLRARAPFFCKKPSNRGGCLNYCGDIVTFCFIKQKKSRLNVLNGSFYYS